MAVPVELLKLSGALGFGNHDDDGGDDDAYAVAAAFVVLACLPEVVVDWLAACGFLRRQVL